TLGGQAREHHMRRPSNVVLSRSDELSLRAVERPHERRDTRPELSHIHFARAARRHVNRPGERRVRLRSGVGGSRSGTRRPDVVQVRIDKCHEESFGWLIQLIAQYKYLPMRHQLATRMPPVSLRVLSVVRLGTADQEEWHLADRPRPCSDKRRAPYRS